MQEGKDESDETNNADLKPDALNPGGPRIPLSPENPPLANAEAHNPDHNPDAATAVRRELHWLEILNFCGQIVLAMVAIVGVCIYGRQLGVMQGQLDQMSTQFPEIQKSANAAKSAAETAHDALVLGERSRVGFPLFNVGPPKVIIGPNIELHGNIELENYGKIPASIDFVGVKLEVRDTPVPEGFKYTPPLIPSKFDLMPGQKGYKSANSKYTISGPDYEAVMLRKKRLVLHGRVVYHDAFGAYVSAIRN